MEVKAKRLPDLRPGDRKWRASDHPRDRRGRFIETFSRVLILGGGVGTILRDVGDGRLEIQRDDRKYPVLVHRNNITVTARPDGSPPTNKREDNPTPIKRGLPSPEAKPDAGPGIANALPGEGGPGPMRSGRPRPNGGPTLGPPKVAGHLIEGDILVAYSDPFAEGERFPMDEQRIEHVEDNLSMYVTVTFDNGYQTRIRRDSPVEVVDDSRFVNAGPLGTES